MSLIKTGDTNIDPQNHPTGNEGHFQSRWLYLKLLYLHSQNRTHTHQFTAHELPTHTHKWTHNTHTQINSQHTHIHTHKCTHNTYTHSHTHSHTHIHTHTHSHTHIHTHTFTHTHSHTHTFTHTHSHTHTFAHTHSHTHTPAELTFLHQLTSCSISHMRMLAPMQFISIHTPGLHTILTSFPVLCGA